MKIPSLIALLAFAVSPAFAADAAVPSAELPAVSHWVYLSELPESADLLKNAAANGLTVKRLDRTNDKVVVTYVYPDGLVASLGYALLSSAGNPDHVVAAPRRERPATETRTVTVVSAEPEIIYEPRYRRTRYIYRDPIDDFWLPLTLGRGHRLGHGPPRASQLLAWPRRLAPLSAASRTGCGAYRRGSLVACPAPVDQPAKTGLASQMK